MRSNNVWVNDWYFGWVCLKKKGVEEEEEIEEKKVEFFEGDIVYYGGNGEDMRNGFYFLEKIGETEKDKEDNIEEVSDLLGISLDDEEDIRLEDEKLKKFFLFEISIFFENEKNVKLELKLKLVERFEDLIQKVKEKVDNKEILSAVFFDNDNKEIKFSYGNKPSTTSQEDKSLHINPKTELYKIYKKPLAEKINLNLFILKRKLIKNSKGKITSWPKISSVNLEPQIQIEEEEEIKFPEEKTSLKLMTVVPKKPLYLIGIKLESPIQNAFSTPGYRIYLRIKTKGGEFVDCEVENLKGLKEKGRTVMLGKWLKVDSCEPFTIEILNCDADVNGDGEDVEIKNEKYFKDKSLKGGRISRKAFGFKLKRFESQNKIKSTNKNEFIVVNSIILFPKIISFLFTHRK